MGALFESEQMGYRLSKIVLTYPWDLMENYDFDEAQQEVLDMLETVIDECYILLQPYDKNSNDINTLRYYFFNGEIYDYNTSVSLTRIGENRYLKQSSQNSFTQKRCYLFSTA